MPDHTYRLIYPPALVNMPVIHQLIRKFDVTVNILGAQIGDEEGWLDLQLMGTEAAIANAEDWLQSLGIKIIQQNG